MATIRITSEVNLSLDQLLSGVAQLDTEDLQDFLDQVSLVLAQRKAASLPEPEASLLQQINQGLPSHIQRRYDVLQIKLQDETITAKEYRELLELIDVVEQADGVRLQSLIELSKLRGVALGDLMQQLGIQPPPIHA